jgi:hypothetical protein
MDDIYFTLFMMKNIPKIPQTKEKFYRSNLF